MLAAFAPAVSGEKVTWTVQELPGVIVLQLVVLLKWVELDPKRLTLLIVRFPVPVLVTVTGLVSLVRTAIVPKFSEVGLTEI